MVESRSGAPLLPLHITHAGRTVEFALPPSSSVSDFSATLSAEFDLSPASLKLLIKGKKVQLASAADQTVEQALRMVGASQAVADGVGAQKPVKALLVGTKRSVMEAEEAAEALRQKKHAAFLHHQTSSPSRPSSSSRAGIHTISDEADDPARYRFYDLQPYPPTVPQFEKRKAMLERLAADPAVRDLMKRHRFAVGVLTELHPILQPTLLGLNTNAGEKVSLRLLTDSLDGCRSYLEVRKVLLHELAHNRFGDHNNDFKELNSLLNREVAAFESSPYFEPWDPAASSSSADDVQAHKLNEVEAERLWDKLKFGLEDEVEEKRERAGRAAEERARRAREGR
ncbi:hypothetical protein JCM6882_007459 [Rhodosporidiobolus microsporus]